MDRHIFEGPRVVLIGGPVGVDDSVTVEVRVQGPVGVVDDDDTKVVGPGVLPGITSSDGDDLSVGLDCYRVRVLEVRGCTCWASGLDDSVAPAKPCVQRAVGVVAQDDVLVAPRRQVVSGQHDDLSVGLDGHCRGIVPGIEIGGRQAAGPEAGVEAAVSVETHNGHVAPRQGGVLTPREDDDLAVRLDDRITRREQTDIRTCLDGGQTAGPEAGVEAAVSVETGDKQIHFVAHRAIIEARENDLVVGLDCTEGPAASTS